MEFTNIKDELITKDGLVEVFTPYITKNGKRIYHPTGGVFHFWAPPKERK